MSEHDASNVAEDRTAYWQAHIDAWRASGLSARRFYIEHAILRRIQHHTIKLGGTVKPGITTLSDEQKALLASPQVEKPRAPEQLTLL